MAKLFCKNQFFGRKIAAILQKIKKLSDRFLDVFPGLGQNLAVENDFQASYSIFVIFQNSRLFLKIRPDTTRQRIKLF